VKIAVLLEGGVPNPEQSGSTLTVWTTIRWLLDAGHEVFVVVLHAEHSSPVLIERMAKLRELGAAAELISSNSENVFDGMRTGPIARGRRLWSPTDPELLPTLLDASRVREIIGDFGPDAAYVYHWEALAASRLLDVPRFAAVVDLPQYSALYRWRATPGKLSRRSVSRLLWLQARLRRLPRLMVGLLEECESYANFAAHHAAWLRRHGAKRCAYMHIPVEDAGGPAWRVRRDAERAKDRPLLLLIGHMRGVSTIDGLTRFARDVLPRLERALGPEGFEVRVIGAYDVPAHLERPLSRPSVRLLGHVDDIAAEFARATATVVATSIPLGTRVRILTAFSHGAPVVAHEANAFGIPELAPRRNVLLGGGGRGLADQLLRVLGDGQLERQLEGGGRETYERFFAPPVAAAAIERALVEVAGTWAASRRSPSKRLV
jgi:hypothetical protein